MKENMMNAMTGANESNIRHSNEVLCALIQEGDAAAKEELWLANRKLVAKYANLFHKLYKSDLEPEDLIQAGALGLLNAAEKFDIYQGTKFTTYCVYWIKQSIGREIANNGAQVRLPIHVQEQIYRVSRIESRYENLEKEERYKAISEETGISLNEVRRSIAIRDQFKVIYSFNAPVGEEGDTELGEMMADDTAATVEEIVEADLCKEAINSVLEALKPREREVLIQRFGLNGNNAHRLEEIGEMMRLTRERIRQIENAALRKLRRYTREDGVLNGYAA